MTTLCECGHPSALHVRGPCGASSCACDRYAPRKNKAAEIVERRLEIVRSIMADRELREILRLVDSKIDFDRIISAYESQLDALLPEDTADAEDGGGNLEELFSSLRRY